jgi:hypothetical protein
VKKDLAFRLAGAGLAALLVSSVASAAGPYQFYSVTPCRVVDTRTPPAALTAGVDTAFTIGGFCGIPLGAGAVTFNVTFVGPTANGFLSIWPGPAGTPMPSPLPSTINAEAGEPAIANGAIVPLNSDAVSVVYGTAGGGTANVILDVTGYFQ